MIEIEHARTIELSADTVWREVRQFDRVLTWIPGGAESTIEVVGEGIGAVRELELATQGYVKHQLVAFDDSERSFSYELIAGKPIGMQDYTVVASVTPESEDRCTIRWQGKMTADASLDEAHVGHALEIALANMTVGIIARLTGEPPQFSGQPNEDWQLRAGPSDR